MKPASDSASHPPRWAYRVLQFALPCDPMRDAILGDLHEEYAQDVVDLGVRRARVRHGLRTVGIVVHAVSDSAMCRRWVSADPPASRRSSPSSQLGQGTAPAGTVVGQTRALAGYVGFTALALVVLGVGIVVNTMLFSASQPQGPRVASAAGIGGVALVLVCVVIGAVIMCAGPRWRRKRLRGA